MKITEFIVVPKKLEDTTSCGTTSSASKGQPTQDIVPQNIVPEMVEGTILCQPDHSAIAEGVSQIFRRKKGGQPTKGFTCIVGIFLQVTRQKKTYRKPGSQTRW